MRHRSTKLAAFDLETAKILPENVADLHSHMPLGITCAALALSDNEDAELWQGTPKLQPDVCRDIVVRLREVMADGYQLVTWNGTSFDFLVLAQESGMLNIEEEFSFGITVRRKGLVGHFGFERGKKAFHDGIVVAVPGATHAGLSTVGGQQNATGVTGILTAAIRMDNESRRRFAGLECTV
jgi:hypothetical protein